MQTITYNRTKYLDALNDLNKSSAKLITNHAKIVSSQIIAGEAEHTVIIVYEPFLETK